MCFQYDDLKRHIKTVLEKDKNVDCNQCNLSTRAKWHLRAHIDISHKWFAVSGYALNLNLLLHWNAIYDFYLITCTLVCNFIE